ncbi:MAG: hypothetical protein AB2A00_13190 [Myxococcota bacterium]
MSANPASPGMTVERYRAAVKRYWMFHLGAAVMVLAAFLAAMLDDGSNVGFDWLLVAGSLLLGMVCVMLGQRMVADLSCPHCMRQRPERRWSRASEAGLADVALWTRNARCAQCGHNPRLPKAPGGTPMAVTRPVAVARPAKPVDSTSRHAG